MRVLKQHFLSLDNPGRVLVRIRFGRGAEERFATQDLGIATEPNAVPHHITGRSRNRIVTTTEITVEQARDFEEEFRQSFAEVMKQRNAASRDSWRFVPETFAKVVETSRGFDVQLNPHWASFDAAKRLAPERDIRGYLRNWATLESATKAAMRINAKASQLLAEYNSSKITAGTAI